jgi:hypothetical protein
MQLPSGSTIHAALLVVTSADCLYCIGTGVPACSCITSHHITAHHFTSLDMYASIFV